MGVDSIVDCATGCGGVTVGAWVIGLIVVAKIVLDALLIT